MKTARPIPLAALCLATLFGWARAGAGETVVVTYTDERKEKGELVQQDLDKIVLRVTVGQNKMDTTIPWTRIKELSNGLTPELIRKQWKEQNKDKLCPDCKGDRTRPCAACAGTGRLAVESVPCKTCLGVGTVACAAKGCEKGQTNCSGPCLKLSEGKWELGAENLRWRKFTYPGGFMSWSERHLGEVVEMQGGKPVNTGKCKTCDGTTKVKCAACEGSGQGVCPACKGAKNVPAPGPGKKCPACENGRAACETCKGTGIKP